MKITTVWLGSTVVEDGTSEGELSESFENSHIAFQHTEQMDLIDEEGWPRQSKPGDIFWTEVPVCGVEISLNNGVLRAVTKGRYDMTLEGVEPSSVLSAGDPFAMSLIKALQEPRDDLQPQIKGITGTFGMGGDD